VPDLFFVVGSPALAAHPTGDPWACLLLQGFFNATDPSTLVLTGGAEGPERWAIEQADECGLHWLVQRPDGVLHTSRSEPARWAPAPVSTEAHHQALIKTALDYQRDGRTVHVVALLWGVNEELDALLARVEQAGLRVERLRTSEGIAA
jgi:hypothetical protein